MKLMLKYFFRKVKVSDKLLERTGEILNGSHAPVFVMKTRSVIDYYYFKYFLTKYFGREVFYAEKFRNTHERLDYCIKVKTPVLVFLKRKRGKYKDNSFFMTLGEIADKHNTDVAIVPTIIIWKKLARRITGRFRRFVVGDDRYPSWMQRVFQLVKAKNAAIDIDQPFLLSQMRKEFGDSLNKQVALKAARHIITMEKAIVGPLLRDRDRIIRLIMKDKKLKAKISELSDGSPEKRRELMTKTAKILDEMSADYRESMINKFREVLNWAWPKVIEGFWVNEEKLEIYRKMSKKAPALVLPCHRSHADYLIVSYLFYKYNLMIPYIAAGINLSFFPMGLIFRRSGAFFIRRSFRGDRLYPFVLEAYVRRLLLDGVPQEFFPEGTRSRTGKMLHPKTGLLAFNLNAMRDGTIKDILISPVSIVYGKLFESGSYKKEAEGESKSRENAKGVLKTTKLLGDRYGKVYLNFANPFYLSDYFRDHNIDIQNLEEKEFRQMVNQLGYRFVRDIQNATVVTPSALTSLMLLSDIKKGITVSSLNIRLQYSINYLKTKNVEFAEVAKDEKNWFNLFSDSVKAALDYFIHNEQIKIITVEGEKIYSVYEESRNDLEYYKNNIIHYFLNVSFVSASILFLKKETVSVDELFEEFCFLKNIFAQEFVYDSETPKRSEFEEELEILKSIDVIDYDSSQVSYDSSKEIVLKNIAGIILSYIESYYTLVESYYSISRDNETLPPNIIPSVISRGKLLFAMGDIRRRESISKFYYQNAQLQLNKLEMVKWDVLASELRKNIDSEHTRQYRALKEKLKAYMISI